MFHLKPRTTIIAILLASMIGLTSGEENNFGESMASDHGSAFPEIVTVFSNGSGQIMYQEGYDNGETNGNHVQGDSIKLLGAWNTESAKKLSIKFVSHDSSISNEVIRELQQSVYRSPSMQNVTNSTSPLWNNLLSQLAKDSKLAPPMLVISESEDMVANVTIVLTDAVHSTRPGVDGEAFVEFNDQGEITNATVTIYKTSALYEEGFLDAVINHELGHALGLGHSDNLRSIMYPSLVIAENDSGANIAIGNIGTCELTGLTHLYSIGNNDHGSTGAPKVDSLECD